MEGEVILQLSDLTDTTKIHDYTKMDIGFEVLASQSQIVKLSFNPAVLSTESFLADILSRSGLGILHAQKNHFTYLRSQNLPNDTAYSSQAGFWNILDAPPAWTKTTGGFTRKFDEVVIAVIDDGVDTAHPDLRRNLWVNKYEVPNDGLDNDNNGYIDDYYGWNTYDDNPKVIENGENGVHGTPVAGLIGSDGNNTTGITGANWKVGVMNVVGGSFTEAENIKAFNYVLQQKRDYLNSNGTKGAYVVALNCSWGLDNQFPKDFPLWCAFYDTLGKYGITTFAATSNANKDIEVFGDMPSLCQSEHLIVVSNMDNTLGSSGGRGDTAVDISAPGDLTYSLCPVSYGLCSNGYKSFNGTSGAAPLAAGLFGLIHSYACDSFIKLTKQNPAAASLLAKKWLMDGAEQKTAYSNVNVSGGILNYDLALKELENWCESVDQPVSNRSITDDIEISIFPNPAQRDFTLTSKYGIQNVQIVNLHAQLLFNQKLAGEKQISLKPGLAKGVYLVIVNTSKGLTQTHRLIIQ